MKEKIKKFAKLIKAIFLVAGRVEYFSADLTPYVTGVFLGVAISKLHGSNFIWGIDNFLKFFKGLFLVICAHYAAVHSNVLSDYELDKKYKSYLSNAVDIITKKRLSLIIVCTTLFGTFLAYNISKSVNNFYLLLFWMIGITSAHIYTLEPIRLKKYPFIGDIARGLPIVIPMLFGYFLFTPTYNPLILYNLIGISLNLFGLFMVGEVWDWKDDEGAVVTVAVNLGYKNTLKIGYIFMPLGVLVWLYSFLRFTSYSLGVLLYVIFSILFIFCYMLFFHLKVYRRKEDYNSIENICGLITKIGTTSLWLSQLIGAIILANSIN